MLYTNYLGTGLLGCDSYHLTSDIYNADVYIKAKVCQWKGREFGEVTGSLLSKPPLGIR